MSPGKPALMSSMDRMQLTKCRLLPSATAILTRLTNPLNVTLLASQLLSASSLWDRPNDLQSCRRILSVFNTAAINIIHQDGAQDPRTPYPYARGLARDAWAKAVVKGADERSPRWRHMLLIGGLLIGFEGGDRQGLPAHLRTKLESALVKATNFALAGMGPEDILGSYCIALVLNHSFELLSDVERSHINYDLLLPLLMEATFQSPEGLEDGYFLGLIDRDIVQVADGKFSWSTKSNTFGQVRHISSKPLISALGLLSRLISHCIENVSDARLVSSATDQLTSFARTLHVQWRQNKLSEVDASEESMFLDPGTLSTTLPALWRLLRTCLFASVIILRSVLGRVLNDPTLAHPTNAPYTAIQALHTLRFLSFVSFRQSHQSSSQYVFINLTAIDILSQHPEPASNFLHSIRPSSPGQVPSHPLDRTLDHFFLNTAEHFTLILPSILNEDLLIASALPYLSLESNPNLLPIFEAAHSVVLAVLSAPQSAAALASTHLPFYITALFKAFPANLSARQFRLAFKTIIRITTLPTSPLTASQPRLPSVLLELVHERAVHAPKTSLPIPPAQTPTPGPLLSEQSVLTLTLIDALPHLLVRDLEIWLPLTATLMNRIDSPEMRQACIERFWDCLSNGEMDVERASFCVGWWGTLGGREMVLFGRDDAIPVQTGPELPLMSGVLGVDSKL
jgi:hypothetical protein